ncbi:MAG: 1-acyl-sn-glycerol-3-phosphate acyltransferase [Bifidobacteriaceae bacterium]|jgi:1-acyl-sn-glycerol-3-phosphate acyltransferase|nr:1-acyl-sn-glycerol-3-phosphate acyltransferase [Bifidobacteriaceae bacterium]MCI1979025.1 1-acyl-sn-glycerol-3-phosphate acyltransferase [Bifidobacteriaceae bacterium]
MGQRAHIYESVNDDFVTSHNQSYHLPPHHIWVRHGVLHSLFFNIFYFIFFVVSWVYAHAVLHLRIVDAASLKKHASEASFIYGNHTLPQGDIALTVLLNYPHKVSAIMSPANFGIPVIGLILRHCDMLAVPHTKGQSVAFKQAMAQLVEQHAAIAIYPEAHVWPYYTKIRPFPDRSFKYPPRYGVPAFASTVTYQQRRFGKRPRVTVFIDGPFYPDPSLDEERQRRALRDQIFAVMQRRSSASTYEYQQYRKKDS